MMEIKCPSCRKVNEDNDACIRCGCDLKVLLRIMRSAQNAIALGAGSLRQGKFTAASHHAFYSWRLRKSPEAARLGFLSATGAGKTEEALQWLSRMS